MAQYQRRSKTRISSVPDNGILSRRKPLTRRGPTSRRRVFTLANNYPHPTSRSHGSVASSGSPPISSRAVLVPLQFNLRRLPSRTFRGESMRDEIDGYRVHAGTKRKRVVSGTENASGRTSRTGAVKRRRAALDSSDDQVTGDMDIDDHSHWALSDNSDEEAGLDSSDSYLINEADPRRLLRLRKDELVRLYIAAGLSEDSELLTKPEIVDCLIAARDDVAELPPSSPGVGDSNSSDYSSDGGNVAGGEETDFGGRFRNGLRRRVTLYDLGRKSHAQKGYRTRSLSQLEPNGCNTKRTRYISDNGDTLQDTSLSRRKRGNSKACSNRSSPTSSTMAASTLPSPPVTRLRTRKLPHESSPIPSSSHSGGSSRSRGKGKGRQVEFGVDVHVNDIEPIGDIFDDESDLTDLTEIEESMAPSLNPSPRRLRSKGLLSTKGKEKALADMDRRVTPMRIAKKNAGSLREDEDNEEEVDELNDSDADQEEEVDQLIASPTVTPKASDKRTPVKRRLRARRIQTHTPPSDGDDEESEREDQSEGNEDEEGEGSDVVDDQESNSNSDSHRRVTRNSTKGVTDEDEAGSISLEDDEEEDEEELKGSDAQEVGTDAEEDEAEESEDVDEAMDDDVDLTVATAKTLIRLRRDDLVRLCETRDIDTTGTKPQLAEALLQWRDCHHSSPSSTGTARPPSTTKGHANGRRKTRSKSSSRTPPVLLRSGHVHLDEPRTPPVSGRQKEAEPELELDLESLGLEDREIPPDRLTKLEKIGSGGFKDVFIGKFKGRKVAIAEFRGQLSAMDIKELKLLGDFDHPNIVRFLGVSIPENTKETPVMIVSELCSNGDLFDYIRNVNPPSLYRVLSIMLDIARGLEYLHTRKPSVIHRDCKSSNILITSRGVAKITDFGLAKVKQSTRSMVRSLVGTVNWQAPELWHPHPKYNHKVDVFSCAMVFWEMLQWHVSNKKFPWEGMNEHAIYDLVGSKRQRPSISGLRKHWCPEIVDLIEHMWAQEHQDRPTMTEVVEDLEQLVQKYR